MHAGAQDLVGFGDIGIGELGEREFGFHVAVTRSIRPRLRMILGSKLWRTRWLSAATPPACGWKTSTLSPDLIGGADQRGMAAGGLDPLRGPTPACASGFGGSAAQIRPPPQS